MSSATITSNSTTNKSVTTNKLSTTNNDKESNFPPTQSATASKPLTRDPNKLNTFSFINIQGLHPQTTKSSVPYLTDILSTENHLFIALTETWLQDNHKEAELQIDGYKLYRKDREHVKAKYGRSSGGVAIYIRKDIASSFKVLLEFSNGVNE